MLDWEPLDREPSEQERGGVSAPELRDVQVLDRERDAGVGRANATGRGPSTGKH
jgi:hypothetical protein